MSGYHYNAPVPYNNELANSFDDNYSFGGHLEPLTFAGNSFFSHDDFFNSFNTSANALMANMRSAFRDDTTSLLSNVMRPAFQSPSALSIPNSFGSLGSFPEISAALSSDPNALSHSHQMTQVMSYSNIDGKPKLIQSHDEHEQGPFGVRRVRKAHRNTAKGIEKMQEARFLDNRGEIREKYRDPNTRQYQQEVHYQNLTPQDQQQFNERWSQTADRAREAFNLPIYRLANPGQAAQIEQQYQPYGQPRRPIGQ